MLGVCTAAEERKENLKFRFALQVPKYLVYPVPFIMALSPVNDKKILNLQHPSVKNYCV